MDQQFYQIAKLYFQDDQITELYNIVKEVIEHDQFQLRKTYLHHDDSVFDHSLHVCFKSLKIARNMPFPVNYQALIYGSLLHDFYYEPWQQNNKPRTFFQMHGFTHAKEAYNNANIHFNHLMNDTIKDIITNHMWPLTIKLPLKLESWIVTTADKLEALKCLKNIKKIPLYLGIK